MTQNPNLAALSAAGVSVWLDDLSRQRLQTGNLAELIATKSVVGVTTNPSVFQARSGPGHAPRGVGAQRGGLRPETQVAAVGDVRPAAGALGVSATDGHGLP